MKYERMTEKEEDWFDSKLEDAEVYDRLAELEDKIENGTIIFKESEDDKTREK